MSKTDPTLFRIGRLDVGKETTFGTEAGSFKALHTLDAPDFSGLQFQFLENDYVRTADAQSAMIGGEANGTFTIRSSCRGYSAATPSAGASGANFPESWLVCSALGQVVEGGYYAPGSDTALTGSSTTAQLRGETIAALASAAAFNVGGGVVYETSGGLVMNWLTEMTVDEVGASDTFELWQASPGTPNEAKLYGTVNAAKKTGNPYHVTGATCPSFSFRWRGHDADDYRILRGCRVVGATFTATAGEIPYWDFTIAVSSWEVEGSGGAPAEPTAGEFGDVADPVPFSGATVTFGDNQASTYHIHGLTVDFGIEYSTVRSASAGDGISNYLITRRRCTASYAVEHDFSAEPTDAVGQTARKFSVYWGTEPGNIQGFAFKSAVIEAWPGWSENEGRHVRDITLRAVDYTADTGSAGATTAVDSDVVWSWG